MIEVGQTFGKYRLLDRIATGGMAEIFKAAVRGGDGRDRVVVIKRLHRSLCDDMELTKMLVDEARISVMLDHPNIGQVFDLGSINNQFFIVMAFIDGRDAHDILDQMRVRREFLPVPAALHIVSETSKALHYAHTLLGPDGHPLNLVHRDVSPQNIMVTFDGRVVLVDFGIAKARMRAQTTQAGVIKGKFYYMAPEQAHGHHLDGRADVFAAGMVLYEMITACSPYHNVSDAELLRAVRVANIPPPSTFRRDIDPELEHIIMTAVARDPNMRFQSADEFRYALEDYARRRFPPVNHREQMAHFVHNLFGSPLNDGMERLDRRQFMASDDSMIFSQPNLAMLQNVPFPGAGPLPSDRTEVYDQRREEPGATARELPSQRMMQGGFPGQQPALGGLPPQAMPPMAGAFPGPGPGPAPTPDVRPFHSGTHNVSATQSLAARLATPRFVVPILAVAGAVLALVVFSVVTGSGDDDSGEAEPPSDEVVAVGSAAQEAQAEVPVNVAFNSIPSNATVKVDGEPKGSTPLGLSLMAGKTYKVTFEKHGYQAFEQELAVTEQVAPIEVQLQEMDGVLKVATYPSEAVVKINGREVGKAPHQQAGLVPGQKYLVSATFNGETQSKEVAWEKGGSPVIDVLFEFEKAPAVVTEPIVANTVKAESVEKSPNTSSRKTRTTETNGKSLSVWDDGDSKATKTETKAETKKTETKKTESEDDGLSVWGTKKKSAPKKTEKKEKTTTKKTAKKDEDLDIW